MHCGKPRIDYPLVGSLPGCLEGRGGRSVCEPSRGIYSSSPNVSAGEAFQQDPNENRLSPRICSRSASTRSGFPWGPNNFRRSINAATTCHFASEARGIRVYECRRGTTEICIRFTLTPPSAMITPKIARFPTLFLHQVPRSRQKMCAGSLYTSKTPQTLGSYSGGQTSLPWRHFQISKRFTSNGTPGATGSEDFVERQSGSITVAFRPMSGSAPIGNFLGTPKRRTHLGVQFSHFTVTDSELFIPACIHTNDETRD